MGIAILGVCLLHAFKWAGIGESPIAHVIGPFARIAFTDGFLFLSGFGLYYSFSKNGDLCKFYTKRVNRVLLPYMIMGLPFFLLGLITGDISVSDFLLKFTSLYFWCFGNDGMWYISVSLALYFIFPVVDKHCLSNRKELIVVAKTLLSMLTTPLTIFSSTIFLRILFSIPLFAVMNPVGTTIAPFPESFREFITC